jgi:hypothetical protein
MFSNKRRLELNHHNMKRNESIKGLVKTVASLTLCVAAALVQAQPAADRIVVEERAAAGASDASSADALAKQLANPVAALISVPIEFTWDTRAGVNETGSISTLIFKPVIPMSLNSDWNLISRTIVPMIQFNDVVPGTTTSGFGDVLQSFFFSPKAPTAGGVIWGVGPAISIPVGRDQFSTNQWGLGPTGVVLVQQGPWTYGALVNQIWGVSGSQEGKPYQNAFYAQPFLSRTFPGGRSLGANLEMNYDWERQQWKIPLNLSASQVTRIGSQMVSFGATARYYVARPDGAPEWGLRFTVTLLFPK